MFPSDTDYETKVTLETEMSPLPETPSFHILILGDWSGRESRAADSDLFESNPFEIDRDNFETVLEKLDVRLNLNFQNNDETVLFLRFSQFDDFHPDRIFQQLPLFSSLRDVRQRLINPQTFDEAAREVRSWLVESKDERASETKVQKLAIKENSESAPNDLLDQILGQTDENSTASRTQNTELSELSALIKELVKPHLIQTDAAEQSKLLLIVDEVISDLMRKILHHPQFQALESAWRGAHFLVRRIETGSKLKIHLLDISKDELAINLKSDSNLTNSRIYRILSRQIGKVSGDEFWAVICGNYTFSLNVDDVAALIRLAKIGSTSDTPFISHLKPEMFGFESFAEIDASESWKISEGSTEENLWTMLRTVPEASSLALALPRILSRLPYGAATEPTEIFYFEEFTASIQHNFYLWSNPIFICALLLAQTFQQYGWNMSQNFFQDVDGLPLHLYQNEFGKKTKPCAEILVTQSNYEKISEQGLISIISFKDTDRIRLGGFQSIAYPPSTLKGKWS